jgi:hypothetical protein
MEMYTGAELVTFVLFTLCFIAAIGLRKRPTLLAFVFSILFIALIVNLKLDWRLILLLIGFGFWMTFVEYICIKYGMWSYHFIPKQMLVPIWLPVAWALASLLLVLLVGRVTK